MNCAGERGRSGYVPGGGARPTEENAEKFEDGPPEGAFERQKSEDHT